MSKSRSVFLSRQALVLMNILALGGRAVAEEVVDEPLDLTEYALEDLMNMEVTSVAKKPQKLSESPAAISVITAEDIRRSGATTIPELLRIVPGLQVAQINANRWSVTSRIFNEGFPKTLLVLIDGRRTYSPVFSGINWDEENLMLEDIERIEVIRGPGAALWGSEAVNGVINILTKKAEDTQGSLLVVGGGIEEQGFVSYRYGDKISDNAHYRAYIKYADHDDFTPSRVRSDFDDPSAPRSFTPSHDGWNVIQGGFRMDVVPNDQDTFTLQGDVHGGEAGQTMLLAIPAPPFELEEHDTINLFGWNTLGRWTRAISDTSEASLQLYYDHAERDALIYDEKRDTTDIDFQYRFQLAARHEIIWGIGYRYYQDEVGDGPTARFDPKEEELHLVSAFIQDEITLVEDRLKLTVGAKLEDHYYTGFGAQPSARMIWTPTKHQAVWVASSFAVREPSRAERDVDFDAAAFPLDDDGTIGLVTLTGNKDYDSEELLSHELGYRVQPADHWWLDMAAFYNDYSQLQTFEEGEPYFEFDPPHLVLPSTLGNKMNAKIYGLELETTVEVTDNWKIKAGYTFVDVDLELDSDSTDEIQSDDSGESPEHQFNVRSLLDLTSNLEFDTTVFYVSELTATHVPSYYRVDFRLGWKPVESMELSLVVQNAFDPQHPEFGKDSAGGYDPTEVERTIYGKLAWSF